MTKRAERQVEAGGLEPGWAGLLFRGSTQDECAGNEPDPWSGERIPGGSCRVSPYSPPLGHRGPKEGISHMPTARRPIPFDLRRTCL